MGSVCLHSLLEHFYLWVFCMCRVYLRVLDLGVFLLFVFLLDLFLKLMIFVWGVLFTCVTCPFCTEVLRVGMNGDLLLKRVPHFLVCSCFSGFVYLLK